MLNERLNIRRVLSARKTGTAAFDRWGNFRSIGAAIFDSVVDNPFAPR
jgi:hypothetical protein